MMMQPVPVKISWYLPLLSFLYFMWFLSSSVYQLLKSRESDYGVMTNFRVEGVVYGRQVEGNLQASLHEKLYK